MAKPTPASPALRVLQTVYGLQFVGRIDPQRVKFAAERPDGGIPTLAYLDPVPRIAIEAELCGRGIRIDLDRELRWLVADGDLQYVLYPAIRRVEYERDDGKKVELDSYFDEATESIYYRAKADGIVVAEDNAHMPRRVEDRPTPKPFRHLEDRKTKIECYSVTRPGMATLGVEPGREQLRLDARRGRPQQSDPKRDAQWAIAWGSGQHENLDKCAEALGTNEDSLKRALDRHRKRKTASE